MVDDFETRSGDLGKRIDKFKEDLDTLTEQEMYEARAAKHATENGVALNSGKA